VRRLVLVNALIFAILAAAVTLAYYSYASSQESRERERQAMRELAQEKVLSIEAIILGEDEKVFAERFDTLVANSREVLLSVHAKSLIVLEDKRREGGGWAVVPGGYASRDRGEKEGIAFRDWFEKEVAPNLQLDRGGLNVRGHDHRDWGGKEYLFSFMKKQSGDRTYYVVIEEDLAYLLFSLIPTFIPRDPADEHGPRSRYVFQVVDSLGRVVYGPGFLVDTDVLTWPEQFGYTFDRWFVRVAERDTSYVRALERKHLFDSLLIGGAVAVIAAGLVFVGFAIRRERHANELKSEFISNVSHELKTPLSIISMFGEMLANGRTKGPEQATEYAQVIWRESVRLGRLIDNVLDFAKMERGKEVYEFAEADVGEVVERAVDLVGRRAQNAEMTIEVEIEPELPNVQLDGNAFTLAVMNLIDNAIKYAADGKKVVVKLTKQGERIVLVVRDFGPGIAAEEQEQIFERFYRARAVRLKPIRGSGIGLALVRHIARAHGGDVSVTSVPGKGATFQLWLPI
jgi:two-component system phosphate regulon sensor histidine kinase PhoR